MRLPISLLATSLVLFACGGGASDPAALASSGSAALNSGDYASAKADFEKGLELIGGDASHVQFAALKLGSIEAEAHINPEKAEKDFLAFAASHPDRADYRSYSKIAAELDDAKALTVAVRVLDAGLKRFEDHEVLAKQMAGLEQKAKDTGDAGALDALQGLGYIGD
jgi:tetratricopeptide (TPR) repeat protein